MNWSSGCNPLNSATGRIGLTVGHCLIFVISLVGNSFIGIIVYRTQAMRKPINFFIVNMAISDQLFPIIEFPWKLVELYLGSWRDSGPTSQLLCKLVYFLPNVSSLVSIQCLILIAVDRFGAVVFPLRSPLIRSKLCPFSILATWIVAISICSSDLFAKKTRWIPRTTGVWVAVEWSFRRVFVR